MKKVVGVFFFVVLGQSVFGQLPFFQNYYLLRKNEPVQVNVAFQDRTGFVWFGTNKGLFRFDGINYRRYTTLDSLPDEAVTALEQDSIGRIWVGHKNGKLAFIENNVIHTFNPREGSATQEVSDILFDRKGNLWFSTLNDGLYYYTQDRLFRVDEEDGLPDLFLYDLEEDKDGNVWVGSDGGVAICTLADKKVSLRVLSSKDGLPDNIIKKITAGSDGAMWIGTEDAGIIRYTPATRTFTPVIKGGWRYGGISDFIINGNQVWIATRQTGLVVYDILLNQSKIYNSGSGVSSIGTMLKDREGNIWAGLKTGVVRTPGDQLEFIEDLDPAKDVNVVALTTDHYGRVWFSNNEGLFRRSVDASGIIATQQVLLGTPFQRKSVISLYTDEAGYVWAGLFGEGVLRINSATGGITYLNKELRNGNILSITGRGNVVWLATLGGGTRIDVDKERLTIKNYGSTDGLSTDYIYQVFLDSKDRVWFGTDGKGVDMLDKSGFHHYQTGLTSRVIYGFAEDRTHAIWVNAQDGLHRFDESGFTSLDKGVALHDNNIHCLVSDAQGNLVVMHDLGIDVYDPITKRVRLFGDELGIRNKESNLNAVTNDGQGHIYFGTDGGIIRYSDRLMEKTPGPQPHISGLRLFDKLIDMTPDLRFSYDENDIVFNYVGFWYRSPESLEFQYMLENYDRDWISSHDHTATYSSLPPGSYTFRLRASQSGEFNDAREATFQFVVAPPFWQTAWFLVMSVVVVGFLVYQIIRYRERSLQRDKKLLEEKVRERTFEIQQKTEEIQVQNEEIHAQTEEIKGINENLEGLVRERTRELEIKNKTLEEYAFINAHELRAPVASILGLINLMEKMDLDPDDQVYLEHLRKAAVRLENVCGTITRAIEKGDGKMV